jgi:hypothetical protein
MDESTESINVRRVVREFTLEIGIVVGHNIFGELVQQELKDLGFVRN